MIRKTLGVVLGVILAVVVYGQTTQNYPENYVARRFVHAKSWTVGVPFPDDSFSFSRAYNDLRFLAIGATAANAFLLQGKDTTALWNAKTLQTKDTTALWNAKTLQGKDTTALGLQIARLVAGETLLVSACGGDSIWVWYDTTTVTRGWYWIVQGRRYYSGALTVLDSLMVNGHFSVNGNVFPADSGSNNYVLRTNGAGVLSWAAGGSGTFDSTSRYTFTNGLKFSKSLEFAGTHAETVKITRSTLDSVGRDLVITAGSCTTDVQDGGVDSLGAFAALSQDLLYWGGIGRNPVTEDVYASTGGSGFVYIQTNGTGDFVNSSDGYGLGAICGDPYGSMYASEYGAPMKKLRAAGTWTALAGCPSKSWLATCASITGDTIWGSCDSTWMSVDTGVTWTKRGTEQVGLRDMKEQYGTGDLFGSSDGYDSAVLKSTDKGATWVDMGFAKRFYHGVAALVNGDMLFASRPGDIYVMKDGEDTLQATGNTSRKWTYMASDSTHVWALEGSYQGSDSGDIYFATYAGGSGSSGVPNLASGDAVLKVEPGYGTSVKTVRLVAPVPVADSSARQSEFLSLKWSGRGLVFPSGDTLANVVWSDDGDSVKLFLFREGAQVETLKMRR